MSSTDEKREFLNSAIEKARAGEELTAEESEAVFDAIRPAVIAFAEVARKVRDAFADLATKVDWQAIADAVNQHKDEPDSPIIRDREADNK